MANKEEKKKRHFFKDFKAELKRVVWPTPKQLVNNTIAVVTIVLVIGLVVFLLDMGFEFLNSQNVKLQTSAQEKISSTEEKEDADTTTEEESSVEASGEESSENAEVIETDTDGDNEQLLRRENEAYGAYADGEDEGLS